MILQRIVYPHSASFEEELYVRFDHAHVALVGECNKIVSSNSYKQIRFDTYFNTFSIKKWKKYTCINQIKLTLDLMGSARIVLVKLELHGKTVEEHIVASRIVHHSERKKLTISFPPDENGDAFTFYVYPLSERVEIYDGTYISDIDESSLREVRLALAICTYRREAFVQRNMDMLRERVFENSDSLLYGKVKAFISDNGNTLDAASFNCKNIVVFPNMNSGGAGGFSRSAMEAVEDEEFAPTNVIMMDDDIQFDAEALERAYVFLRLLKPQYRNSMIGGAMFPLDDRCIQHAAGETMTLKRLLFDKRGYDMKSIYYVLQNEVEEIINYLAWWFCCVPIELLAKDQYALPLFFQYDDIEFSIRNDDVPKITLNGICCWHSSFNRWPGIKAYYSIRNCAIVKSICFDEYSRTRFLWEVSKRAIKNLFQMSYKEANLALMGGEDFLKGLSWVSSQDPQFINDRVSSLVEKTVPGEVLNPVYHPREMKWNCETKDVKRISPAQFLTLNGWILPSKKVVTVELNNPPLKYLYRAKTVIKYDTYSGKGIVVQRSYKKAFQIMLRLGKLCWNTAFHFRAAVRDCRESREKVSSKEFWKAYLKL